MTDMSGLALIKLAILKHVTDQNFTTREADGTTFGRIGLSVSALSICPVCALTFESLDLETSFLIWRYIFRISRPSSYVKVISSRSRSHEPKTGFTSGPP